MSDAMERVFGRHKAEVRSISGVYGAAYEDDDEFVAMRNAVAEFAKAEGPPAPNPGRQDGPGRPRPRRQGRRHRVRRPRLRRRLRPAVRDAGRGGQGGDRERRARRRRVVAGGRAQDARAPAHRGAEGRGRRRHRRRCRRRDPAAGLRLPVRARCRRRVRPGHEHPRGGATVLLDLISAHRSSRP